MSTITKRKLSESTSGKRIKIAATASSGTLLHTATSGTAAADDYDEVWLNFYNSHTSAVLITIQWGGTTSPDDDIKFNVASKDGAKLVLPGDVLQNSLEIRAYASVANVVTAGGFVNRMAP